MILEDWGKHWLILKHGCNSISFPQKQRERGFENMFQLSLSSQLSCQHRWLSAVWANPDVSFSGQPSSRATESSLWLHTDQMYSVSFDIIEVEESILCQHYTSLEATQTICYPGCQQSKYELRYLFGKHWKL